MFVKPPYMIGWLRLFLLPAAKCKMLYSYKLCELLSCDMILYTIGFYFFSIIIKIVHRYD